jgi:hypothetical protein
VGKFIEHQNRGNLVQYPGKIFISTGPFEIKGGLPTPENLPQSGNLFDKQGNSQ